LTGEDTELVNFTKRIDEIGSLNLSKSYQNIIRKNAQSTDISLVPQPVKIIDYEKEKIKIESDESE